MNKLIKDGKVGVLYSPGYGAGWYSWHHNLELLFDPEIISMVEQKNSLEYGTEPHQKIIEKLHNYTIEKYPDDYIGGIEDLTVSYIPEGTKFRINEYDGSEEIILQYKDEWITA